MNKMNEVIDTDEKIVGCVTMRYRMGTLSAYVSSKFIQRFALKEIVFNAKELTFRESTIFDNKTYGIHGNSFCIKYAGNEELVGQYNIVQPNEHEKEFQLIRTQ